MHILNYLEQLTPSTLKKMLEEHQLTIETKSPNELVNILVVKLLSQSSIYEIYQKMTKEEREVLSYFIIQNPNQLLLYRKLERITGKLTRDQFEYGLIKLRRKGILFSLRRSWGDLAFTMPEDLFRAWHLFYFNKIVQKQVKRKTIKIDIKENKGEIESDLFRFLSYVQFENVPITQKGTIHKRHISKIEELIKLKEEEISYFPIRYLFNNDYPKNVALLLHIAHLLDLVDGIDTLKITAKTKLWHQLNRDQKREFLEVIIRSSFKSSDLLIQQSFLALFYLPQNEWYGFKEYFQDIAKFLNRPIGKELIERAKIEVIGPLHALGWIDIAQEQDSNILFKLKDFDNDYSNQIYVQANYEILVPQTMEDYLRLQIEQFSELISQDNMSKYLLTKESVLRGLELDGDIEEFLELLTTYSVVPISDNVKKTLNSWASNYGSVSFMDVMIMKIEDENLANEILTYPSIDKHIVTRISSKHFIIRRDEYNELLAGIHNIGIKPKKGIWTERVIDLIDEEEEPVIELFLNKDYRVENIFPSFPKTFMGHGE